MIFSDWWFAITSTSSSVAKRQIKKIPQRLYRVPNAQFFKQVTLLIGVLAGAKKLRIGYSILGLDLAFKKGRRTGHQCFLADAVAPLTSQCSIQSLWNRA